MKRVFVDCGGNIGQSLKRFLEEYSGYDFYCFEPNRSFSSHILDQINESGGRIFFYPGAVWTHDGFVSFFLGHDLGSTAQMGKVEVIPGLTQVDYTKPVRVPCLDFSRWINTNFSEDDDLIVKMDIEGGEYEIIPRMLKDGSMKLVKKFYCEWHQDRFPQISREQHDKILNEVSAVTTLVHWD